MFIDELEVHIKAGDGGDGVVRWRHEKFKEFGGPSGGDGGNGGDVYIQAERDTGLLAQYRHKKEFEAEDGENGKAKSQHGKNGDDLVIELPVGTVVTNRRTGERVELLEEGEKVKILNGGRGGYGNEHFKGAENQRPQEWTAGKSGEEADFFIELELVVDAGFIGLPNAGKSSLLNELTNAESKVGSYEFTTLSPALGDLFGFILADIPGLIEGAAEGKGLGHTFLRHVKRTKIMLHCISLEHDDVAQAYKTIRGELSSFNPALEDKREIIILTKKDVTEPDKIEAAREVLQKEGKDIYITSILDDESIKNLRDELVKILREAEN